MKKLVSILFCIVMMVLFTLPVLGEERKMIQLFYPGLGSLGYEKEFNNNHSFIISGTVNLSLNLDGYQYHQYSLSGGMRFYNGSKNIRIYEGLYDKLDQSYSKRNNHIDNYYLTNQIIGVLGLEWRFGKKKCPSLWIESGFSIYYPNGVKKFPDSKTNNFKVVPTFNTGLGINI